MLIKQSGLDNSLMLFISSDTINVDKFQFFEWCDLTCQDKNIFAGVASEQITDDVLSCFCRHRFQKIDIDIECSIRFISILRNTSKRHNFATEIVMAMKFMLCDNIFFRCGSDSGVIATFSEEINNTLKG